MVMTMKSTAAFTCTVTMRVNWTILPLTGVTGIMPGATATAVATDAFQAVVSKYSPAITEKMQTMDQMIAAGQKIYHEMPDFVKKTIKSVTATGASFISKYLGGLFSPSPRRALRAMVYQSDYLPMLREHRAKLPPDLVKLFEALSQISVVESESGRVRLIAPGWLYHEYKPSRSDGFDTEEEKVESHCDLRHLLAIVEGGVDKLDFDKQQPADQKDWLSVKSAKSLAVRK
jgi:hypothetical protein